MKKIPLEIRLAQAQEMAICAENACSLIPLNNKPGFFTHSSYDIEIDLTACALDEKSILRTTVIQLADKLHRIKQIY